MWKLNHNESWVPKNWCFWTVVLEKTLESPLDCKEIQPFNPKGNQSWIFIGRTDAEAAAAAAAKSLQSCPTLCDPIDSSPPGSSVPGILQARTLEWIAMSFSNAWKWRVKVKSLSRVWLSATPWTAAYQAPLSMGFSRQEYWHGCHCLLCLQCPTCTLSSCAKFPLRLFSTVCFHLSFCLCILSNTCL